MACGGPATLTQARAGPLRRGRRGARAAPRRAAARRHQRLRGRPGAHRRLLSAGERVDAIAVSKGKGFAGGMKRHNFKGQGAAHGNHKKHRPGFDRRLRHAGPGLQGHPDGRPDGRARRSPPSTSRSSQADADRELILVKGAVPGPRGGMVVLRDTVKAPRRGASMTAPPPIPDGRAVEGPPRARAPHRRAPARRRHRARTGRARPADLRHRAQRRRLHQVVTAQLAAARAGHPVDQDPRRGRAAAAPSRSARRAPAAPARARPAPRTGPVVASPSAPSPAPTASARRRR